MRLGVGAAVVDGGIVSGDVEISDGVISAVGLTPAPAGGLAVPGFVDLQVNGFAGVDFLFADVDGYARAHEALLSTGVTSYQPTLVSAPLDAYWSALPVAAAAQSLPGPRMLGVHLEGPFLNEARAGAHNLESLREPDPELTAKLLEAGPVTYMTVAPELHGGFDLIDQLVGAGVTVAMGHTDADAATAHHAVDRGVRAITHIWNAHRRWQARDPGVGGVALVRPEVTVETIVDHLHLAPETSYATYLATRGRFALVTDAVGAAGLGDGTYSLGGFELQAREGAVRLPDGTLAGSVLTMDQAVRNLVGLGVSIANAVDAATRVPANLVGRAELGTLRPGTPADVAVLDDAHQVVRTLVNGQEAFAAP